MRKRTHLFAFAFLAWSFLVIYGITEPVDIFFKNFRSYSIFWKSITYTGSYELVSSLALMIIPILRKRERVKLGWGTVIAGFSAELIKRIVRRPRPVLMASFAYPSGHSTVAFFFYLNLYRVARERGNRWAWVALLPAFLVPLSRVVLGVHWFSDVVGGILLALLVDSLFDSQKFM